MKELKKCPFCGSEADIFLGTRITYCTNSECMQSKRIIPMGEWNTRPIEDELAEQITAIDNIVNRSDATTPLCKLIEIGNALRNGRREANL